ncbi:MAG: hypothetical protein ACPGQL_03835 [Thermoplasmatota archaeon]
MKRRRSPPRTARLALVFLLVTLATLPAATAQDQAHLHPGQRRLDEDTARTVGENLLQVSGLALGSALNTSVGDTRIDILIASGRIDSLQWGARAAEQGAGLLAAARASPASATPDPELTRLGRPARDLGLAVHAATKAVVVLAGDNETLLEQVFARNDIVAAHRDAAPALQQLGAAGYDVRPLSDLFDLALERVRQLGLPDLSDPGRLSDLAGDLARSSSSADQRGDAVLAVLPAEAYFGQEVRIVVLDPWIQGNIRITALGTGLTVAAEEGGITTIPFTIPWGAETGPGDIVVETGRHRLEVAMDVTKVPTSWSPPQWTEGVDGNGSLAARLVDAHGRAVTGPISWTTDLAAGNASLDGPLLLAPIAMEGSLHYGGNRTHEEASTTWRFRPPPPPVPAVSLAAPPLWLWSAITVGALGMVALVIWQRRRATPGADAPAEGTTGFAAGPPGAPHARDAETTPTRWQEHPLLAILTGQDVPTNGLTLRELMVHWHALDAPPALDHWIAAHEAALYQGRAPPPPPPEVLRWAS